MDEINTERLHVSTIDVKPANIDWRPDRDTDEEDEPTGWWDAFEHQDLDDADWTLIAHDGYVVAVVVDGTPYRDWSDYAEAVVDATDDEAEEYGAGDTLTEHEFNELLRAEPYRHATEGPMMNYWYPIEEDVSEYSSFDPIDAALRLKDLPLCVVRVDDRYGIALTGGGMDFSWEICAAFVALGKQPPTHFADLPVMASRWGEREQLVYEAMKRSLTVQKEWAEQRLDRLDSIRERFINLR